MKGFPALLFLCIALSSAISCIKDDYPSPSSDRATISHRSITTGKEDNESFDLFYTTVEFPSGYDWRRDSLYGSTNANICLYKNGEHILDVPTGELADAAADLHHFLEGHLYTQKCTGKGTVLACDGEEILRFSSEEILRGLVQSTDGLYSLWSNRSGSGFCLRRGSSEIFRKDCGMIAGSLYDYSYLPNGALYKDNDHIVFCFSSGNEWFYVSDGTPEKVSIPAGTVLDMKVINGMVCTLCRSSDGKSLLLKQGSDINEFRYDGFIFKPEGKLFSQPNGPVCMANAINSFQSSNVYSMVFFSDGSKNIMAGSDAIPLSFNNPEVYLRYENEGQISFSAPSYGYVRPEGTFYQMGGSPGTYTKDHFAVALNPKVNGKKPILWENGEYIQLKINGFLSGVYSVSQ